MLSPHTAEPPSPGSSGVPQPTQTQLVTLCEAVLAVHVSQDLSSPQSPAKAGGKGLGQGQHPSPRQPGSGLDPLLQGGGFLMTQQEG